MRSVSRHRESVGCTVKYSARNDWLKMHMRAEHLDRGRGHMPNVLYPGSYMPYKEMIDT